MSLSQEAEWAIGAFCDLPPLAENELQIKRVCESEYETRGKKGIKVVRFDRETGYPTSIYIVTECGLRFFQSYDCKRVRYKHPLLGSHHDLTKVEMKRWQADTSWAKRRLEGLVVSFATYAKKAGMPPFCEPRREVSTLEERCFSPISGPGSRRGDLQIWQEDYICFWFRNAMAGYRANGEDSFLHLMFRSGCRKLNANPRVILPDDFELPKALDMVTPVLVNLEENQPCR
jgi:hypothetical protein